MLKECYNLHRTHAASCKLLANVSSLSRNAQDNNGVFATTDATTETSLYVGRL